MYFVIREFLYKDDSISTARNIMDEIVKVGRTEKGIVRYTFYQDPIDEYKFFLFEEWESKELHDEHFNSDFMQGIVPKLFDCLNTEPTVSYYEANLVAS